MSLLPSIAAASATSLYRFFCLQHSCILQHLYHDSLSEDAMYVEYLTDQFMNIHIETNSMEMPAFVHKTLPSGTQLFNQTKTALKE